MYEAYVCEHLHLSQTLWLVMLFFTTLYTERASEVIPLHKLYTIHTQFYPQTAFLRDETRTFLLRAQFLISTISLCNKTRCHLQQVITNISCCSGSSSLRYDVAMSQDDPHPRGNVCESQGTGFALLT
jgi:hypothetical protein